MTPEDMEFFFTHAWKVDRNSNRMGVRLESHKWRWARTSGGVAGGHPSNILDNGYAVWTVNMCGDQPIILVADGPSLGGFICNATLIYASTWKVGQLVPGRDTIPDLMGFGRRRMSISPQELKDYVTYQVGALQAFAAAEGARVEHVKPHGMLYVMCTEDDTYAQAVAEAVRELGDGLVLLLTGARVAAAAKRVGVPFVMEGYIDLDYDAKGSLILERAKKARDPDDVA